jgi:cysteine desulfurase
MLKLPVYLDYNATTPCDARVAEVMMPYFTSAFGNPASRDHSFGWQAQEGVAQGREQVADLVGCDPTEIVFTSGATESVNLALKGVCEMYAASGDHIITTGVEHKAVLDSCAHLEKQGISVTLLPVMENGLINLEQLEAAFTPRTILVAIMYANNETGVVMPVKAIGEIAKRKNRLFFTDATQAVGKIPVNVRSDGIDLMAFNAHKMYGPKGIGALYVRRRDPRVTLTAQMDGGGHERGLRSGTLNVPAIAGFGKACALAGEEMATNASRLSQLRDRLETAILSIAGTAVNGDRIHRLPHVTNISFGETTGDPLLAALRKTVAVSTGSACMSASLEPSYVLKAMGIDDDTARRSLRFSLGRPTSPEEIDYTIQQLNHIIAQLRAAGAGVHS